MRSGEGFLLVYSVTDRARYVNKTKKYVRLGEEFVLVYARYDKTIEGERSMREHVFVSGRGGGEGGWFAVLFLRNKILLSFL